MKFLSFLKTKQAIHEGLKQESTTDTLLQTASSDSGPLAVSADGATIEERIRSRAYQLYQERGAQDGYDVDDWVQAERELLVSA